MAKEQNKFSDTLHLPQTDFPMRAGLPKNEPKWLERWDEEAIYDILRKRNKDKEKFIVHLGPPYANGNMHMGHALTYVLKDIIVRFKGMQGFDSPYVPGWDCHGLPIEWKVETELRSKGKSKNDLTTKELRDLCRDEAAKWIEVQMADWQRFGCIGDWDEPYKTMNRKNEAGELRELGKMMANGYLYKGVKSVMWSTVEETALAEAEIEYADKESKAIFVKYPVEGKTGEYVVIWTTTPWTMPASKAVCYGNDVDYVAVEVTEKFEKATVKVGDVLWMAKELLEDVCKMCGVEDHEIKEQRKGSDFEGTSIHHPFYNDVLPMLYGEHVTTDAGTGFVHTAPAHGAEDFLVGLEHGLDLHCPVEGDGAYAIDVRELPTTGEKLAGHNMWKMQDKIIDELTASGSLLRWYKMKHSYPVSWRSKAPLIFRTTPQWFVDLDKKVEALNGQSIRERSLECIHGNSDNVKLKQVNWVPGYGEKRIGSMIAGRPDWCISRQRAWGVPIAIFSYHKDGEVVYVNDMNVFEHIATKMEEHGIDAWEILSTEELLPTGWLEQNNLKAEDLTKETDILDVWFDSGTTHAHVMRADPERFARNDGKRPADVYLEGSDQHRGWFHSSLLTSVANYGDAPYENVITNGFVVDGNGHKMSKSVGNVVSPHDLIKQYGMDIVRMWVAGSDYSEDIRLSDEIMKQTADAYRRMRNTFRFLLGNLSGFNPETDTVAYDDMPELEQYMLAKFSKLMNQANDDYDNYHFHRVYHAIHNFCSVELSSLYFDIRKDSLYCDAANDKRRRACQTVLFSLLKGLTTYLAPLMPFTTDEVWRTHFGMDTESIHLQEFMKAPAKWANDDLLTRWDTVLDVRSRMMKAIEGLREAKEVGHSLESGVKAAMSADELKTTDGIDWEDICIVSKVETSEGDTVTAYTVDAEKCPRCWKRTAEVSTNGQETCNRCADALEKNAEVAA